MKPKYGIVCLLGIVLVSLAACSRKAAELSEAELNEAFERATEELVCFNFPVSYQMFGELLESMPSDHPQYFKSLYARATCAQHITPPTEALSVEAIELFQKIVDGCPDKQLVGRALINLGRIAELRDYPGDEVDMDKARVFYQKVIDAYPDQELADEAMLWNAGTYIQVVDDPQTIRQGVELLEQWLVKRPDNVFASPMLTYMGSTYQLDLNEPAKALACYIKADEIGLPAESQISAFYWRMAMLAEKIPSELDTSVLYYQKIIRITPTSGRAFESQLALERLAKANPGKNIQVPKINLYQIGE
ncbi:MAG TPA: hypothetical protein DCM28_23630 [Phycisphaerales bacterium]|nr:hypothetical protein [Phycisphaerales bacterium]HCD35205.1 hypothetical protein [Phycisphaerales bacterium]|tara:strand:+ start:2292 stop:3206 length:915 start_codon:yes stop_codon:yes gene_type:complete